MIVKDIKTFIYGIINALEPQSLPKGSAADALNFLSKGDKIELRRGYRVLGGDQGTGGEVTGLRVGTKKDEAGSQIAFLTQGRKVEYYDPATETRAEVGSNALPAAASGEDVALDVYDSQAGAQLFLSSPNSSIYKILVANPGSITDLASTNYRGYIRVKQNRMFLWNRKDTSGRHDEHNLYLSYIDARSYTTVSGEALADLAAGTLAFKSGNTKRTCFAVLLTLTSTGETFTDNRDGTLTGSLGGTGTINYTTGAFTTSVSGAGTADYQHEDSTSTGLGDFSFSGTRVASQGNVFLQGDGGPLQAVESFGDAEFCGHKRKTYKLVNGRDDTTATNLIFRDREGVPYWRAMKGSGDGVYYINDVENAEPFFGRFELAEGTTSEVPTKISDKLKLTGFNFDRGCVFDWGDFILFFCKTTGSTVNNRCVMYNRKFECFDIVDLHGNVADILDGALVIGESVSKNLVEAFSGVDDDGAAIAGFWKSNLWDVEYPGFLKKVKKLQLQGEIGPDQIMKVKVSVDRGPFVEVGEIRGDGEYVDRSQRVNVGSQTLGRGEVGGGSELVDGIEAYNYFKEIDLRLDKFEFIQVMLETGLDSENNNAEGIGYFSMSEMRFYDVRVKAQKLPRRYRN